MSVIKITGKPVASFEFIGLPSWNTTINQHWTRRKASTKEWRMEGNDLAYQFKKREGYLLDIPLIERALIVVKIYPPFEEVSDIHNVNIKAVCDGFSDALLFEDDEWSFVPVIVFMWAGIDEGKERRTIIDVYELDELILNGEGQVLPAGRKNI